MDFLEEGEHSRIATGLAEETEAEFEDTQLGCSCPLTPTQCAWTVGDGGRVDPAIGR